MKKLATILNIRGIIRLETNERINLTCCTSIPNIAIGDKNLYNLLIDKFNESIKTDGDGEVLEVNEGDTLRLEYIILDQEPEDLSIKFEDLAAETILTKIYSEWNGGCYSVWTCGTGGFDYVVGEEGHSLFRELKTNIGKWAAIKINKMKNNK